MNTAGIREALSDLLDSPAEANAFAIVEGSSNGKFVQFTGSNAEGLLLDLPHQALDATERILAERVFASTPPHVGLVERTEHAYDIDLGSDVDAAVGLAERILTEVYGFRSDSELEISTHFESVPGVPLGAPI